MIMRKELAVVEDFNGLAICALTGDTEFVYNSFKNTINEMFKDDSIPESVKALVLGGKIRFLTHYLEFVHDNTPTNNKAVSCNQVIEFPVEDVLKNDFASKNYCIEFSKQLEKFVDVDKKLFEKSKLFEQFKNEYGIYKEFNYDNRQNKEK